jgi:hypothetical protein
VTEKRILPEELFLVTKNGVPEGGFQRYKQHSSEGKEGARATFFFPLISKDSLEIV